ncbi:type II secretion system minor pseudopilin GspI [Vibrio tubiashii]|jgi:general secretion pathway protein I|uniref:Type II secretion system protein I n=2 Tax=Vibrio tubiashii TaxID=29498 RepID=F9T8K7_9VIBR|nr:type II secretion system minor pseudopilin GspI [Vibrio tubiashii]AIW12691.1 general secretion pathway protein GspI [Vibrio tubiashii ATCC 19109]EGU52492.1 general secretion pathway protein I [Vibrio tubiashii ATCC 19109]EIF04931.1 general secretion pathway protein I [Vibrio tubiashii NCIMB 1337 = ATCC 19106]MCG9576006.1 type II secretion system minor pseudopilin GspI [Vibrio tubiashii]NOI82401.1 type II secretion system protein GspI [Vibrio tubiashii]|tara:strand:+ start:71 stop:427 length:357 start_codon:yes stop_codon:yes gene_type:complete
MKKAKQGFTLLEVLVALAIFATAAIATIRSVSQHINTLNFLEEKTFAAMVADNQMAKVILSGSKPSKKKGKETLAQRDWFWTVEPVSTAGDMLQAFDVKVATSEKGSPVVTVRSYVPK